MSFDQKNGPLYERQQYRTIHLIITRKGFFLFLTEK